MRCLARCFAAFSCLLSLGAVLAGRAGADDWPACAGRSATASAAKRAS